MGERERKDSLKVLQGKRILDIKRIGLLDYILYPYRAWKEKKRQEALRQSILDSMVNDTESLDSEDVK